MTTYVNEKLIDLPEHIPDDSPDFPYSNQPNSIGLASKNGIFYVYYTNEYGNLMSQERIENYYAARDIAIEYYKDLLYALAHPLPDNMPEFKKNNNKAVIYIHPAGNPLRKQHPDSLAASYPKTDKSTEPDIDAGSDHQ